MGRQTLSRRDFLKVAGITLGATALACSGLTALANYRPPVMFEQNTYGDPTMKRKILVAYATKCGSTFEVAEAIGKTIAKTGTAVDVMPVKEVTGLAGYDAVLLGSAVRMGQWLPEAIEFAKKNQAALETIPTAIFTVHILNTNDSPASAAARQSYTAPLQQIITPRTEVFFAGKIDPALLNFFEMTMFKLVNSPEGDFRDWGKIEAWAETACAQTN